jgi:hypothetical protein
MIAAGVAWLAAWGVAVGSTKPSGSLRYLDPASYVAIAFVMVGFLVVVAVMYDWPARLWELRPVANEPPLKVTPGMPHYHDWNWAASVAALPVKIRNRTGRPVDLPGGCRLVGHPTDVPSWDGRLSEGEAQPFRCEVASQQRSSHHSPKLTDRNTIPAHASLEVWHVVDTDRDYRGGRQSFTLYFNDSDGNEYSANFEGKEPRSLSVQD